jgi:WD40 repeat protein
VWHPDGEMLATATRNGAIVQLWDIHSKEPLWELHKVSDGSRSLTFSSNGKYLITSSALAQAEGPDVGFSLIDIETGRAEKNIDRPGELKLARLATSWTLNKA